MRLQPQWKVQLTSITTSFFAAALVLTSVAQGLPLTLVPQAEAATYVVTPDSLQDWELQLGGTASGGLVSGPGTPPLGTGSVMLSVGSDGSNGAQFRNDAFSGTPLGSITQLEYSTYVSSNAGCQAPYLILNIDTDNDNVVDDLLFFEPCYQTGTYGGSTVPNQGAVALNTWQDWDALAGGWWANSAGTGGPPLTTLADYLTDHPNARIMNSSGGLGGIRIIAGFGAGAWDNFVGNSDAFTMTVSGTEYIYDFEPADQSASSASSSMTSESSSVTTSSSVSSSSSIVACDPYADAVTAFDQGNEKGGGAVAANRSVVANALGAPTAGSAPRFVSLGFSGAITIQFSNYIMNGTGDDLRIFESTNATNYPLESAQVWASQTGSTWTLIGTADSSDNINGDMNTTDLDLGDLPWAQYIQLVDTTDPSIHATGADAFDINALQALHSSCSEPVQSSSSSSSVSSESSESSLSSVSSVSSSLFSLSSSSSMSSVVSGPVPTCNDMPATVYVDENGIIVGGRDDGEEYEGVLRGSNGNDVIVGTEGDDRIYGSMGDDVICGAGGEDELDGGNGQDQLAGEGGEDELDGGNGQDLLCGHDGNDDLDAGNSSDQLDGGPGTDTLDAGNGQDVCRNGEDNDDCESSGGNALAACADLVSANATDL